VADEPIRPHQQSVARTPRSTTGGNEQM